MKPKTILLWSREDLLSTSVEFFLAAQEEWNVVSVSGNKVATLVRNIHEINPDVVIISQERCRKNMELLMDLFLQYPELRIITLNMDDNQIEVYSKQNIMVQTASDFIAIVEANLSSKARTFEIVKPK